MDSVVIYVETIPSLELVAAESAQRQVDQEWIINVKDAAFPPDHQEWLKQYERPPNAPIKQSYRHAILQAQVDTSAPTIDVAIIFAEGQDKPSVNESELKRRSDDAPPQKTPEWRVNTAATLLRRFEVDDEICISRPDNSGEIMYRRISSARSAGSLIPRNIQDQTLTIDSNRVKLIYPGGAIRDGFHVVSTLIEVDLFSIANLMSNYRQIISSMSRNVATSEILMILDQMINDVRRLCTRSPRLFRMSTRSLIAGSKDTRYGVNYGTVFTTMMTSGGVRRLIEKSSSYYLSLNDERADQKKVRPIFLQMLVLLLSFLNDDDLNKVQHLLEDTFQLPSDRAGLELVIFKVLPLSSIDSQVFLDGLCDVYNHLERPFKSMDHLEVWKALRTDLANRGYLLPSLVDDFGRANSEFDFDEDLEAVIDRDMEDLNLDGSEASTEVSWFPSWPRENGFEASIVFQFLQHQGPQTRGGARGQDVYRALNDVPHLDITAEDKDCDVKVIFTTGAEFRVQNSDPDLISQMECKSYVLKPLSNTNAELANLVIDEETLNGPLSSAVKCLNKIIRKGENLAELKEQKRNIFLSSNKFSGTPFFEIDMPVEAKRVSAKIMPANSEQGELCAEAFKLGNRVVYRDDVVRDMGDFLTKITSINNNISDKLPRFETKKPSDEWAKKQNAIVRDLFEDLQIVKNYIDEAKRTRQDLMKVARVLPSDPISKVMYPSLANANAIEFERYSSQLSKDERTLLIQCRTLTSSKSPTPSRPIILGFKKFLLSISVEPLLAKSSMNDPEKMPTIVPGTIFLWLGYYLLMVELVDEDKKAYKAMGWFRVLRHEQGRNERGVKPALDKPQRLRLV
jgi:hypothetical protein